MAHVNNVLVVWAVGYGQQTRVGADLLRRSVQSDSIRALDASVRGIAREFRGPAVFRRSCCVLLCWTLLGPVLGYSGTWQMVTSFGLVVLLYLAVSVIRRTQERYSEALWTKLDAVLGAMAIAHSSE